MQLHFIVGWIFVQLRVHLPGDGIDLQRAGVFLGGTGSGGLANGEARSAGLLQLLQLLYGQLRQILKGQIAVQGLDALDEGGLAHGDAVCLGLGLQPGVLGHHLAEDGGARRGVHQGGVDLLRQRGLQAAGPLGVGILHGDEDGGGDAVQIAVLQQRAHDGVHRHIQLGALQVHIRQDHLGVLVHRVSGQDLLLLIDL